MSIWPASRETVPALLGSEGELVLLQISVEPRLLEELLEALARLDFPVNPELSHRPNSVAVEFPAWSERVQEVRKLLDVYGFDPTCLEVHSALLAHD